jgi:hypothetical protein
VRRHPVLATTATWRENLLSHFTAVGMRTRNKFPSSSSFASVCNLNFIMIDEGNMFQLAGKCGKVERKIFRFIRKKLQNLFFSQVLYVCDRKFQVFSVGARSNEPLNVMQMEIVNSFGRLPGSAFGPITHCVHLSCFGFELNEKNWP